jgi:hypothetical protein
MLTKSYFLIDEKHTRTLFWCVHQKESPVVTIASGRPIASIMNPEDAGSMFLQNHKIFSREDLKAQKFLLFCCDFKSS